MRKGHQWLCLLLYIVINGYSQKVTASAIKHHNFFLLINSPLRSEVILNIVRLNSNSTPTLLAYAISAITLPINILAVIYSRRTMQFYTSCHTQPYAGPHRQAINIGKVHLPSVPQLLFKVCRLFPNCVYTNDPTPDSSQQQQRKDSSAILPLLLSHFCESYCRIRCP